MKRNPCGAKTVSVHSEPRANRAKAKSSPENQVT